MALFIKHDGSEFKLTNSAGTDLLSVSASAVSVGGAQTIASGGQTLTTGDLTLSSGKIVQTYTSTATTGTVRSLYGKIYGNTAAVTTANLVGVRGECNLGSTATVTGQAYLYGCQGKFICAGTLNGSAWAFGLVGQLDVSTATLTAGSHVGAIWGDMGATATGTVTFADMLVLTNTTAMVCNSHLYTYGKASYWADISSNSSACVDATSHGSTAAGRLKIKVNGSDAYLHVYSD